MYSKQPLLMFTSVLWLYLYISSTCLVLHVRDYIVWSCVYMVYVYVRVSARVCVLWC